MSSVTYRFFATDNERLSVEQNFDERTYRVVLPEGATYPDWVRLDFERCPNCNLPDQAYCPAAAALAQFLPQFESKVSFEKAVVEVETPSRTVVSKTTFQHGMAALIGLAMATSGCPRTRFLRPMARTHLPFSTDQETVFRALAVFLLGQYVAAGKSGAPVSMSFAALKENYSQLSKVNNAMAERIRAAIKRDAAVNAVIILESFTLIAPENIDFGFEDIQELFVVEED